MGRLRALGAVGVGALLAAVAGVARAQERYETTVSPDGTRSELSEERAGSTVKRVDIEQRVPRSSPDALRYEPGVFVQQSAHGQGSAFLRGLTGQQTLLLFDGIRLNNSTYRQGPNQYFFTLDSHTVQSIEILRGGGSTSWGSDALGGVIDAHPIEAPLPDKGWTLAPRFVARGATADSEYGGRVQLEAGVALPGGRALGFIGGIGARRVGLLTGKPVLNPNPTTDAGVLPWVPRYKEYVPGVPFAQQPELRTQLGTGFQEVTGDGRLSLRLSPSSELTVAAYVYRQLDAPRTDQCAPPLAPPDQCLTYEEQFRHLVYGAWRGSLGDFARDVHVTLSWQQQHERRRLDLSAANLVGLGIDHVDTVGVTARAATARFSPARWLRLRFDYGVDTYFDHVRSRGEHTYTDTLDVRPESRGQYLEGSRYLYGGLYANGEAVLVRRVAVRGGARFSWIKADAPSDPQSGSKGVDRAWFPVVGHVGVEVKVTPWLDALVNYDHSFRAPNLDDMTSRQQTGPGFQFENANLEPERANTFEAGARVRTPWIVADAWIFETLLDKAILKVSKAQAECPPATPQCQAAWTRLQLENAPSYSELRGVEGSVKGFIPGGVTARATVAYVWSEGPRVGSLPGRVFGVVLGDRVPLSRTPPLNGTVEVSYSPRCARCGLWRGLSIGGALQWAATQDRMAIADLADARIPKYATPGFAVVHLRASYRLGTQVFVAMALENLLDSPYRFHGSSVNGAGRGLMVTIDVLER